MGEVRGAGPIHGSLNVAHRLTPETGGHERREGPPRPAPVRYGRAVATVQLRADRLDWRIVDGDVVALDRTTSEYLAVNETGAAIWPALAAGATRGELRDIVTRTFVVAPEVAAADLDRFLAVLEDRGLIEAR